MNCHCPNPSSSESVKIRTATATKSCNALDRDGFYLPQSVIVPIREDSQRNRNYISHCVGSRWLLFVPIRHYLNPRRLASQLKPNLAMRWILPQSVIVSIRESSNCKCHHISQCVGSRWLLIAPIHHRPNPGRFELQLQPKLAMRWIEMNFHCPNPSSSQSVKVRTANATKSCNA